MVGNSEVSMAWVCLGKHSYPEGFHGSHCVLGGENAPC